jgi:hypothetical protein
MTQASREQPILFSAPMVLALLAGTKGQTRRVIKPQPFAWDPVANWPRDNSDFSKHARCPYGRPGDRLWVRETYFAFGRWVTQFSAKKGRDEWHFIDMTLECGHSYSYPATDSNPLPMRGRRDAGVTPGWWKRPAIFMPRTASRILLEVTEIRVQKLQGISEEDCIAEGCKADDPVVWWQGYKDCGGGMGWVHQQATGSAPPDWMIEPHQMAPTPHLLRAAEWHYERLWSQINGPGSWDANPWVWAVSFKRL